MGSEQTHQGESLPVACLLTFAAGLLDIYSYMLRGHVFANAITGNMVLLGMNLAAGHWLNCGTISCDLNIKNSVLFPLATEHEAD